MAPQVLRAFDEDDVVRGVGEDRHDDGRLPPWQERRFGHAAEVRPPNAPFLTGGQESDRRVRIQGCSFARLLEALS